MGTGMIGASNDDARRADDEAVDWVIRLREDPADEQVRAEFEAWLAASPLNARAWADTAYAYDRSGDARPAYSPPVRAAEDRPVLPPGPSRHRRRHKRNDFSRLKTIGRVRKRTLIAGAAAACLALVAAPSIMLRAQADYQTGVAELANVSLDDGSIARLAPGSAIAVSYAASHRHIRLLKGEAWFDVRHDASRPFYVDAKGVTTTVLGTTFNVRLDPEGVTTELAHGQVRVTYGNAAPPVFEQLAPGETLWVGFDGTVKRDTRPVDQVAAWRKGQIAVRDRPATEVIDALRPWFSGIIIVRGDGFARQRITGVYNAHDPVEALRGLTQAYGGSVSTVTPWVTIVTSN